MHKSLTWIQLNDIGWLLVCVNYIIPISLKEEIELQSQGIGIQKEGVIVSTSSYTYRSYRVWKKDGLSKNDKLLVENILKNKNID